MSEPSKPSATRPSFSPAHRWAIGFDVLLRSVLVLAVVVMVNFLAARFYHRCFLSPQTRIVLISGQAATVEILSRARERGYEFELLPKPIHPALLIRHLRKNPPHA